MRFSTHITGSTEERFLKYMDESNSKNKSATASELIELGLRVKENKNREKPNKSDRQILEELLKHAKTTDIITAETYFTGQFVRKKTFNEDTNDLSEKASGNIKRYEEMGAQRARIYINNK